MQQSYHRDEHRTSEAVNYTTPDARHKFVPAASSPVAAAARPQREGKKSHCYRRTPRQATPPRGRCFPSPRPHRRHKRRLRSGDEKTTHSQNHLHATMVREYLLTSTFEYKPSTSDTTPFQRHNLDCVQTTPNESTKFANKQNNVRGGKKHAMPKKHNRHCKKKNHSPGEIQPLLVPLTWGPPSPLPPYGDPSPL